MTVEEAMKLLQIYQITNSKQMLYRWIRQGKIEATQLSKRAGYDINSVSLTNFINMKKNESTIGLNNATFKKGYDLGYKEGYIAGKDIGHLQSKHAVKEREKVLIQKELYEDFYTFNYFDLEKKKQATKKVLNYLWKMDMKNIKIGILGSWAMIEETHELIEIDTLPYPNRHLKTRLRTALIDLVNASID